MIFLSLGRNWRLAAVILIIFSNQLAIYNAGFIDVSGDGFFRALMTYQWRLSPYLVSREFGGISLFWFTPYFWLSGIIYWLSGNLILSLRIISLVASLIGLVILYQLTRHIANQRAATITVLLVGLIPYHLWLSISMADTMLYLMFVLLGFFYFLRWLQVRRSGYLLASSVAFLACTMLRPEGWLLAAIFSLYVTFLLFREPNGNRILFIISGLIPFLFISYWLIDNWIAYGNPFYFIFSQKEFISGDQSYIKALSWVRAVQLLFFMFLISPLLFLVVFTGLMVKWRNSEQAIRIYLLFVMLHISLLVTMFLFGVGTNAAPQRYGMAPLILLTPFAGWLFADANYARRGVQLLVLSFAALYLTVNLYKGFQFPLHYQDAAAAGEFLRDRTTPAMESTSSRHIADEFEIRYLVSGLQPSNRDFLILASDHAAMALYSGRPEEFLSNPLRHGTPSTGPLDLYGLKDLATDSLNDVLQSNHVDTLLIRDRALMEILPDNYHLVQTFGRYSLFELQGAESLPQRPSVGKPRVEQAINRLVVPGVQILGQYYYGNLYPVTLVLRWKTGEKRDATCPYSLLVRAQRIGDESQQMIRRVRPIFCWYGRTNGEFEDHVSLDLTEGLLSGTYRVSIAVVVQEATNLESDAIIREQPDWIELAPVRLAYSKRQAIVDQLMNRQRNWIFLLQILAKL